jgi:hypothetical protein
MQLEWSETELKRIKDVYSIAGGTLVITSSGSWGADRVLQHASMDARSSQGEVKAGDELVPNQMELRHHGHGSLGGWLAVAWCARGQAELTHERQQSYRTIQRRLAPLRTNGGGEAGSWPVVARSAAAGR